MNQTQIEKCKKILEYYGRNTQTLKLIEEMSELAVEIIKIKIRPFGSQLSEEQIHHFWEEMADVLIVLEQLIQCDGEKARKYIRRMITYKLDRQLERIKNGVNTGNQ